MSFSTTPAVSARFGSPMGRPERSGINSDDNTRFHLQRVRLNNGGYDAGGAYWGVGAPLYCAFNDGPATLRYFRARSRDAAKEIVRKEFPWAQFYR